MDTRLLVGVGVVAVLGAVSGAGAGAVSGAGAGAGVGVEGARGCKCADDRERRFLRTTGPAG